MREIEEAMEGKPSLAESLGRASDQMFQYWWYLGRRWSLVAAGALLVSSSSTLHSNKPKVFMTENRQYLPCFLLPDQVEAQQAALMRLITPESWRNCGLGDDHSLGPFPGNLVARLGLEPRLLELSLPAPSF